TRLWIKHHVPLPKLPPKRKPRAAHTVVVPLEPTISSRAPPSFDSDNEADVEPRSEQPANGVDSESELSDIEEPPPVPPTSNRTSKRTKRNGSVAENGKTKKRSAEESTRSGSSRKRVRVVGTRVSSRLRRKEDSEKDEDDDWQPVPDEWKEKEEKKAQDITNDDPFGSDSDLTEVDELERELEEDRRRRERLEDVQGKRQSGRKKRQGGGKREKVVKMVEAEEIEKVEDQDEGADLDEEKRAQLPIRLHMAPLVDPMLPPPLPPGFIEWETVCATLQDWEAFSARFEKATHPNEKSFKNFLNNVLVPAVTTSLRAQLKVKKLETAVQNRKRSSRIAIKESIIEAQRKEEERRAEELELHARARRVEERERRAHEDALRREREREEKVRLRETRAGRRNVWDGDTTESGSASPAPDLATPDPPVKIRLRPGRSAGTGATSSPAPSPVEPSSGSGTSSRTDDPWELLCEGCGKQGWNIDDGSQLVKCESCGRWSHTTCHDRADELAGYPKRNWSAVDFKCRACSNTARKPATNGVPKANGAAQIKSTGLAPPPAYMYTSFQAVPNGHMPTQPPIYPSPIPQALYAMQTQPRLTQPPAFAPFIQHQPVSTPAPVPSPISIPIPQYQTPVPPISQPPS
ncbi:hypothetical protein FRC09_017333, partial [Ceratobasidium sp. 395]